MAFADTSLKLLQEGRFPSTLHGVNPARSMRQKGNRDCGGGGWPVGRDRTSVSATPEVSEAVISLRAQYRGGYENERRN